MSDDTFTRTVELLGSVEGYNMSQLRALKNKAKRVINDRTDFAHIYFQYFIFFFFYFC